MNFYNLSYSLNVLDHGIYRWEMIIVAYPRVVRREWFLTNVTSRRATVRLCSFDNVFMSMLVDTIFFTRCAKSWNCSTNHAIQSYTSSRRNRYDDNRRCLRETVSRDHARKTFLDSLWIRFSSLFSPWSNEYLHSPRPPTDFRSFSWLVFPKTWKLWRRRFEQSQTD